MTELTVAERVTAGVQLLDKHDENWQKLIDPTRLDMSSLTRCVVGQVFSGWSKGQEALGINGDDAWQYGFDAPSINVAIEDWEALRVAWLAVLDS